MFSKVDWEPSPTNQAFSSLRPKLVLQEGEGPGSDPLQSTKSCSLLSHSPSSSLTVGRGSSGESVWTCPCHQYTGPVSGVCTALLDRELFQRNREKLITSRQGEKPSCSPSRAGLAPSPAVYAPQEVVLLCTKQPLWTKQAGVDKALDE